MNNYNDFMMNSSNGYDYSRSNGGGNDKGDRILAVCKEFLRGVCDRAESHCKFAHPTPSVEIKDGNVTICLDFIRSTCNRTEPPCRYMHPPYHLMPGKRGSRGMPKRGGLVRGRGMRRGAGQVFLQNGYSNSDQNSTNFNSFNNPNYSDFSNIEETDPNLSYFQESYDETNNYNQSANFAFPSGRDISYPQMRGNFRGRSFFGRPPIGGGFQSYPNQDMNSYSNGNDVFNGRFPHRGMLRRPFTGRGGGMPIRGNRGGMFMGASRVPPFNRGPQSMYMRGDDYGWDGGYDNRQNQQQMIDKIEACREFLNKKCDRQKCRFAHPEDNVRNENGQVTVCKDFIIHGSCKRSDSCRYYHMPDHLIKLYGFNAMQKKRKRLESTDDGNSNMKRNFAEGTDQNNFANDAE